MFVQTFLSLHLLNKFSPTRVKEEGEREKEGVDRNERDKDGEEEEREEEEEEKRDRRAACSKSDMASF